MKPKEEINPYVSVTYGGFVYEGDFRCIPALMETIDKSVLPLMRAGNKEFMEMANGTPPDSVEVL